MSSTSTAVIIDPSFRGGFCAREQHAESSEASKSREHLREVRVWGLKHKGEVAELLEGTVEAGQHHTRHSDGALLLWATSAFP